MIRLLAAAIAMAVMLAPAHAQPYPSKPVRIVVQAAGAPIDLTVRVMAELLRERLGQPFVVENRPGAGGGLSMKVVTNSAPDGHTLFATFDAPLTISPSVYPNFPVDPLRQFVPIAIFGDGGASVLVVQSQLPVTSLEALVQIARRNPGTLNYASGGHGTISNILSEMFKRQAGIDLQHIPHNSPVAAVTEVLAQRVAMYIAPPGLILGHIRAGTLRPLAVAAAKRSALLPEVPTFAEAGYGVVNPPPWWFAILAPAQTPVEVVDLLNAEVLRAAHSPKLREHLANQGLEPGTLKPAEVMQRLRRETEYWRGVVQTLGIKAE